MKRIKRISLLLAVVMMIATLCACDPASLFGGAGAEFEADLLVHFLDVGQGDSIFIELPTGKTMLIDSGENYHGAGIVSYIKERGYSRIDYLIGTHPHSDHIGSMAYIVRHIDIGSVFMPRVSANTKMYEELLRSIEKKSRKVQNGKAGRRLINDDEHELYARILAPVTIDEDDLNNCSIVLRLDYREATFLFTGDAEQEELKTIGENVAADVLKVGHHGSRNANPGEFLEKADPQIAVISCGVNNDYGHPHQETLARLERLGCDIFRTDRDKTVTVYSDGERLSVGTGGTVIERVRE